MLSLFQAIASSTAAGSPDDFLKHFDRRIQSLSGSQDLLVGSNWQGVKIRDLLRSQLGHFEELLGERIGLFGPDILMQPSAVQPVGTALHELGTNAGKYDPLSNDAGRVDISWDVGNGGSVLQMAWREPGARCHQA